MKMIRGTGYVCLAVFLFSLLFSASACGEKEGCWKRTILEDYIDLKDVHATSSGHVYVVGSGKEGGHVIKKTGDKWEPMDGAMSGDNIWACSDDWMVMNSWGVVMAYSEGEWSESLRTGNKFRDIWAMSENDVFIVGYERPTLLSPSMARIFHYDGEQWTEMENEFETLLHGVWGSSPNDVFAVGSEKREYPGFQGTILHYDGISWSLMKGDLDHGLNSVWGTSHDDVFAVGDGGLILHYDGYEWSEMQSGSIRGLRDVWGASGTEVYAAGDDILYYDGVTWRDVRGGIKTTVYGIWGLSATEVYAVGMKHDTYELEGSILEYICEEPGMVR